MNYNALLDKHMKVHCYFLHLDLVYEKYKKYPMYFHTHVSQNYENGNILSYIYTTKYKR